VLSLLDEISAIERGATFYRTDLHVHTFGGSHDVVDRLMTPEAIVAEAVRLGLDIVAITDHNEICNVEPALAAAVDQGVLVIPGVELSTSRGHLLAYLPTLSALRKFYGRVDIVDAGNPESRCKSGVSEILDELNRLGGFGVLAHVDGGSGFEHENPGGSPHKADVICHPALLGLELTDPKCGISYSEGDSEAYRAQMGSDRISKLGLGSKQFLARLVFSDAHSLSKLGKNAARKERVSRIKMDTPSFSGLRIALDDADARVRIEDDIPRSVPQILGIRFEGGFLDGEAIHLSQNLNCIIGGRGTGKSTTFEALRCLTGPNKAPVVDSEIWPQELSLLWRDAAGNVHTLRRPFGEDIFNEDDPETGPVSFRVECYGQGETAKLSQRAQTDPLALLSYLDRFVDVQNSIDLETEVRDELLELQTRIEEAENKVKRIPDLQRQLTTVRQQLAALQQLNAAEVIAMQRNLAMERTLRGSIEEDWRAAREAITSSAGHDRLRQMLARRGDTPLVVGASEYTGIAAAAERLQAKLRDNESELTADVASFDEVISDKIRVWKQKDASALAKIEEKRKELEAKGVRLDMAFIQKLARDEADFNKRLEVLNAWKPHLTELRRTRKDALKRRWAERERTAGIRDAYARKATATLRNSLTDLHVTLKYARNAASPQAAALIQQAMGWRTNQVPRATLLTESMTLPSLLEAVEKKKIAAIAVLTTADGAKPFSRTDATDICERLGDPQIKAALERAEVHDLPRLTVTKNVAKDGAEPRYVTRDFARLSLGQQQSVLLALLLASEGSDPLIIDQPEDNLDGEFIYSSFVPVLRRAKERRQIVVVTHNPNIAVLGDAELIVVLKSQSDKGVITTRGSIDHAETRDAACVILEGAREAFTRRARIYGMQTRSS
jgi:ABC-type cobalamin/Fe3+-siderophores transport system ATPase subunit